MKIKKLIAIFGLAVCMFTVASAQPDKAQVMVLGVYHFDNPNRDFVKTNMPDHLSDAKQREIAEVLDLLAAFKPNKIIVEASPESGRVAREFQRYLAGEYALTANEIDQLGYRLAKRLGHKEIFAADHQMPMDMNAVMAAAQETNNRAFLERFQATIADVEAMTRRFEKGSVLAALQELNAPMFQDKTRDLYFGLTAVRSTDKFTGADVLAAWYQRNFRIMTNIHAVVEPGDRVIVIFGQGHAPYLREGIAADSRMQIIEPVEYLSKR